MNDIFDFDDDEEYQTCNEPPMIFFPKQTSKKKKDQLYPKMIKLFEIVKEPDCFEVSDDMYFCFFEDIVLN